VQAGPTVAASFPDDLQIDPSGKFLYATQETGPARRGVGGYAVAGSGALAVLPGSPFAFGVPARHVDITIAK
jgi:hypothetical protein